MKTAIIIFLCMLIIAAIAAIAAHIWRNIETEIHRQETDLPALRLAKFYKKSAKENRMRKWQPDGIVTYGSSFSVLTPEQQERLKNIVARHEMPKDAPKITQDDIMKAMTYKSN